MEVKSIGVVGAGKMGNGISLSAAMAGFDVVLQNRTPANLEKALVNIAEQVDKLVSKNRLSADEGKAALARIKGTSTYEGYNTIDFVVEVVAENAEIKAPVLAKLDEICKPECIITSSTSTLSITTLATNVKNVERFVGMHFFLAPTKLVEVIRGYYTGDVAVKTAIEVGNKMGKVCVEVKRDTPGFIANRVYTPLFLEAFRIYEEGIATKEDIDLAMENSYLPIGPFKLADIIGLDVLYEGMGNYREELGDRWNAPQSMRELIKVGRLGKKSGKGWYNY